VENKGETDPFRFQKNDINYELYGAGIISSYDETKNVIACAKNESAHSKFIPFDIEEVVMTRFDYSKIQDRYYVIESMSELYRSFYENKNVFWFEG